MGVPRPFRKDYIPSAMETMLDFGTADSCALKIEALEWHVREYLQPLVARVKVPRCRCHGAG